MSTCYLSFDGNDNERHICNVDGVGHVGPHYCNKHNMYEKGFVPPESKKKKAKK